ncbi:YHS domain protein [Variibacter gotjawalensis]|uniref:YHS domain protein n=1 Tax=Variibacter gotjawalensis TaxID=1333996 RepID=A0A0S3PRA8_9BRAD|nr:YHS domain-containing (seleno)protein [Variibacter gotjawalensis]NIK48794.1 YHS domain-containing protein [Variibacter gotjawalensis]RZS50655.1 hypothetical protein EV661_3122 [Variibacter gotjawalensis]BAT58488.1 YHS domain protein [Variibacter gotjawalensis]
MMGTLMGWTFAGSFALHAFLLTQPLQASEFNVDGGLAIAGHDPVSYFREQRPAKGSAEHSFIYGGAVFRFVSAENRDLFAKDPAKYAPQYGGFCAYGTSRGYKAPIDPAAFTIVKGKLYLNYSADVQATWRKDIPGYVKKADGHWPSIKAQ